ncbi:protein kinase superfamily protein [Striga asiatica]|uniref:Protein kinase superfamily protein n=1 Tax=Striga asiatica TaxID=4170 RepID=A0A5A7PFS8_STRAF|nr:protein kinase superfamily protein [Striga asiatica]
MSIEQQVPAFHAGEFLLSAHSDDCPNEEQRRPPPSTSRSAGVENSPSLSSGFPCPSSTITGDPLRRRRSNQKRSPPPSSRQALFQLQFPSSLHRKSQPPSATLHRLLYHRMRTTSEIHRREKQPLNLFPRAAPLASIHELRCDNSVASSDIASSNESVDRQRASHFCKVGVRRLALAK